MKTVYGRKCNNFGYAVMLGHLLLDSPGVGKVPWGGVCDLELSVLLQSLLTSCTESSN